MNALNTWHTIVYTGTCDVPTGPWPSRTKAHAALSAWESRQGAKTGPLMACHSIRIVGPFRTKKIAKSVDISDYTNHLIAE